MPPKLAPKLAPKLPSGAALISFDMLDSTSLEAKRQIDQGVASSRWIMAGQQMKGYGRRGSAWRQSSGDVAASFIFPAPAQASSAGQLSYAAALSVVDAVRRFTAHADLSVKWPNDVLMDGAKLSGIMLELIKNPMGEALIVLGVGVNIVSKPSDVAYPTARLLDADLVSAAPPSPRQFVEALDEAFDHWRGLWERDGFEALRGPWTALAAGLGREMTARLPDREICGVFKGLAPDGALILETPDGPQTLTAGEVFFGSRQA